MSLHKTTIVARNIHCQAIVLRSDFGNSRFQLFPTWFVWVWSAPWWNRSPCAFDFLSQERKAEKLLPSRITADRPQQICQPSYCCCHRHSCQLCQLSAFSCRTLSDSQVDGARPALVQLLKESVEAPALAAAAEALRQLAEEPTQRWAETKKNEAEHVKASN